VRELILQKKKNIEEAEKRQKEIIEAAEK